MVKPLVLRNLVTMSASEIYLYGKSIISFAGLKFQLFTAESVPHHLLETRIYHSSG